MINLGKWVQQLVNFDGCPTPLIDNLTNLNLKKLFKIGFGNLEPLRVAEPNQSAIGAFELARVCVCFCAVSVFQLFLIGTCVCVSRSEKTPLKEPQSDEAKSKDEKAAEVDHASLALIK